MTKGGAFQTRGVYSPRLRPRTGSPTPSLRLTTAPSTIACEWRSMISSARQSKAATASESTGAPVESVIHCAVSKRSGSVHAAVSAEAMRERLMAGRKQVDRECARLAQSGERRRGAREANDQRRRRQRQGRERDDSAAAPRFAFAASDDRDPRGQRSHRMSKGGAVGVAQAPVAHARASVSGFAKA